MVAGCLDDAQCILSYGSFDVYVLHFTLQFQQVINWHDGLYLGKSILGIATCIKLEFEVGCGVVEFDFDQETVKCSFWYWERAMELDGITSGQYCEWAGERRGATVNRYVPIFHCF